MNILDFFDRVEIISLVDRVDRQRDLVKQFSKIDREIDGINVKFYKARRPHDAGNFPNIGARGCFESHLQVLKSARDDGVDRLLIIEDDLNFYSDIIANSSHLINYLEANPIWGFLYLGNITEDVALTETPSFSKINATIPVQCSHMIAVSGEILADVVNYLEAMLLRPPGDINGGPMHVDGAYSWFRKDIGCTTLIAYPPLGYQRSSLSDISGPSNLDRLLGYKIAGVLRKIKNKLEKKQSNN